MLYNNIMFSLGMIDIYMYLYNCFKKIDKVGLKTINGYQNSDDSAGTCQILMCVYPSAVRQKLITRSASVKWDCWKTCLDW